MVSSRIVGHVADRIEALALGLDGGSDGLLASEGMRPASLGEAPEEGLVAGLEKDDARLEDLANLLENRREAVEANAFAHIDDQRGTGVLG